MSEVIDFKRSTAYPVETVFNELAKHSKKTDKKKILIANKSNMRILDIFKCAYDPFTNYWIKKYNLTSFGTKTLGTDWLQIYNLLQELASRQIVGNAAIAKVESVLAEYDQFSQAVFEGILKHNLTLGISPDMINAAWPDAIIIYEAALAAKIEDRMPKIKKEFDGKTWFASRKLDGLRCLSHVTKSKGMIRTRNGNPYNTLDVLHKPLISIVQHLPDDTYVFDGECCIMENGLENFQKILSEWNKDNWQIEHPKYMLFDFMTEDQFYMKEQSPIFSDRYANILEMQANGWLDPEFIEPVEQVPVTSEEQVNEMLERGLDLGWEGVVLRKNLPYQSGRTVNMLKIKPYDDDEFEVLDLETGVGSYEVKGKGMVKVDGVKRIIINYKGTIVKVGSGLTMDQRKRWKDHPEEIIGKIVTIQYFHEIKNKDGIPNMRHPVLKAVYSGPRQT